MNRTLVIATIASLTAASLAMSFFGADTLKVRKLDDIAEIGVPKKMKEEWYKGDRERWLDRFVFTFVSTYTWASFGSTKYKQALTVAMISPHADDAAYQLQQNTASISYTNRTVVHDAALGSGHLTVQKGTYEETLKKPAYEYVYIDKVKRLRLDWHAVEEQVKLEEGLKLMADMVASFKVVKDPAQRFADLHDRPNREAKEAERRIAVAKSMLAREGFKDLLPGKPQQKGEMYVEWFTDPEVRYQLLVPLGRLRAATPDGGMAPRPFSLRNADGTERSMAGSVGWYAKTDEGWEFSNDANAYYPFDGIQAVLKAQHTNAGEVLYYYVATVRVEEMDTDEPTLTGIAWFTKTIPEVQQLWREGKLVQGTIIGSAR